MLINNSIVTKSASACTDWEAASVWEDAPTLTHDNEPNGTRFVIFSTPLYLLWAAVHSRSSLSLWPCVANPDSHSFFSATLFSACLPWQKSWGVNADFCRSMTYICALGLSLCMDIGWCRRGQQHCRGSGGKRWYSNYVRVCEIGSM